MINTEGQASHTRRAGFSARQINERQAATAASALYASALVSLTRENGGVSRGCCNFLRVRSRVPLSRSVPLKEASKVSPIKGEAQASS